MAVRLEFAGGLDVLDRWLDSGSEADRAAVFAALFAISDGSAFLTYGIFKIGGGPDRFLFTVRRALAVRVRIDWARSAFDLLGFTRLDDGRATLAWPRELDAL